MDNKFQVLSYVYFDAGYFRRSIYLENLLEIFAQFNWHFFTNNQCKSILLFPSGSYFVNKFCFLPAILSGEIFIDLWTQKKRNFYWKISLYTNMPSYCTYWGETAYLFCYISRSCHWEVPQKILLGRAAFFLKLQAVRIIQRFPRIRKWLILYDKFCRHILKYVFLCETIYRLPETVSWRCF